MSSHARNDYLATEVLTAAPQKLQLMLVEAAIRFGHQARHQWEQGNNELASEALIRSQQILCEMLAALKPSQDAALVSKVRAVYAFVFRSLVEAHLQHDAEKLTAAMRVLEEERETWQQMCRLLGQKTAPAGMTFDSDAELPRASFVA